MASIEELRRLAATKLSQAIIGMPDSLRLTSTTQTSLDAVDALEEYLTASINRRPPPVPSSPAAIEMARQAFRDQPDPPAAA